MCLVLAPNCGLVSRVDRSLLGRRIIFVAERFARATVTLLHWSKTTKVEASAPSHQCLQRRIFFSEKIVEPLCLWTSVESVSLVDRLICRCAAKTLLGWFSSSIEAKEEAALMLKHRWFSIVDHSSTKQNQSDRDETNRTEANENKETNWSLTVKSEFWLIPMFAGFKSLLRKKRCLMVRVTKCRSYSMNDAGWMNEF